MADALEQFILHGDARKVDAWWAENGVGGKIVLGLLEINGKPRFIPNYTTDRTLSHVIEDRVRESGEHALKVYAEQLFAEVTGEEIPALVQAWRFSELIGATNRERILAAARAMGLEYDG